MSEFLPLSVNVIIDPFFGESRLEFEEISNLDSDKPGIRFHNAVTAFFLKLFGKIIDIKDCHGKTYHLNLESTMKWVKLHDYDANYSLPVSLKPNLLVYLTNIGNKYSVHYQNYVSRLAFLRNRLAHEENPDSFFNSAAQNLKSEIAFLEKYHIVKI